MAISGTGELVGDQAAEWSMILPYLVSLDVQRSSS